MIRNKNQLLKNIPREEQSSCRLITDILDELLARLDPENLTAKALHKQSFSGYEKIYVIGCGKAAAKMAMAAEKALKITEGHVIIPKGEKKPALRKITYTFASHPLPDSSGVAGAKRIMKIARKAGEKDLVIALISGGGSALMPWPAIGVSLKQKTALTEKLMKAGADIHELNTVRKHLSRIKGGFLAKAIYPARCFALVISDVLGDDLSVIASGPLSPDRTGFADARKILKKYNLPIPSPIAKGKNETPKPGDPVFKNIIHTILANHSSTIKELKKIAKERDLPFCLIDPKMSGEARVKAKDFVKKMKRGNTLYLSAGETTVTVKGKGSGGRNQEFALSALESLEKNGRKIALASLGTDGVDGFCPKPTAGALVYPSLLKKGLPIQPYLDHNDSWHFFKKAGGHLLTGPTGNNLGDVAVGILI